MKAVKKDNVIIYQPGKVGSSSVHSILRESDEREVTKIHGLVYQYAGRYGDILRTDINYLQQISKSGLSSNHKKRTLKNTLGDLMRISKARKAIKQNNRIKIITLVREPISRNFSSFFQNYRDIYGEGFLRFSIDKIDHEFKNRFNHLNVLEWYDYEFKKVIKLDLFTDQFDKEKGYCIMQKGKFDVLVLKMEQLNHVWKEAFEGIGLHVQKMKHTHAGSKKDYKDLYNNYKMQLKLEPEFLDSIYSSKYMTTFYDDSEIEQFYQNWSR